MAVFPYDDVREAIEYITAHPSPLAAYWYGDESVDFAEFRQRTISGGISRNDFAAHLLLPDVAFGGVGRSGMGSYHGKAGFDTFSHKKAVASSLLPNPAALSAVPAGFTPESLEQLRAAVQSGLDTALSRISEGE